MFHKAKVNRDGHDSRCKVCRNKLSKEHVNNNKEYYHKYTKDNSSKASERSKEWRKDKDKCKDSKLRYNYNITLIEYNEMLESQSNLCSVCDADLSKLPVKNVHLDHNHQTGKVRGILCSHCNLMIGHARDNSTNLRKGADYLDASI